MWTGIIGLGLGLGLGLDLEDPEPAGRATALGLGEEEDQVSWRRRSIVCSSRRCWASFRSRLLIFSSTYMSNSLSLEGDGRKSRPGIFKELDILEVTLHIFSQ